MSPPPSIEGADGSPETVARYYRQTAGAYRKRMELEGHQSIHYGYFEPEHRTGWTVLGHDHAAANVHLKEVLADAAGVDDATTVLDAGCGIGETACWLAEHRGADVIGLNITDAQLDRARSIAEARGVADRTDFRYDDYMEMGTVDADSVDVVWGLESMCYARDKSVVIEQARRVLRPGGRLVVADGFMNRRDPGPRETRWMETYLKGWAMPHFAHHEDFVSAIDDAGFADIDYRDATDAVLPSSKFLYLWATAYWPVALARHRLGSMTDVQYRNLLGARAQYKALRDRVWVYGIVTARLPAE